MMKIKSITLTSEHEIKNSNPNKLYIGAKHTPVYQIEYEESTPTGLKATGKMVLDGESVERVISLFRQLEQRLGESNNEAEELRTPSENLDVAHIMSKIFGTSRNQSKDALDVIGAISENAGKEFADSLKSIFKVIDKEEKTMKHVTIFGKDKYSSSTQYKKLYDQFKGKIINSYNNSSELAFETKDMRVAAYVFSDAQRGRRLDEIYVDADLSINALNSIKMMKRENDTPIHYF